MRYEARSILAINALPFGRSLGLLPAIRALRAAYPRTFLVAAAPTGVCQLLSACGLIDESIDLGVLRPSNLGLKRLLSLARASRRHSFELVLDFSPRLETQIVSRLMLRGRTITPSKLTGAIDMVLGLAGLSETGSASARPNYASVLAQAGVELQDTRLGVAPTGEQDAQFERLLSRSGSRGGELIALLFSSDVHDSSNWPVQSFAEIGTRLVNNLNVRIVAADQPADDAFTAALIPLLPAAAIKFAEPSALELIAAIARSSIVVTDDAGVAQVATELHTPVIEVSDSLSAPSGRSDSHRIARGSSRARVTADEVYELASEVIQASRSVSLFERR